MYKRQDIDCELYSDLLSFEGMVSAIRTQNSLHENNKLIKCYIFDVVYPDKVLEERIDILSSAFKIFADNHNHDSIILLDHVIVHDKISIEVIHDKFVNEGYEGLILRKCLGNQSGITSQTTSQTTSQIINH